MRTRPRHFAGKAHTGRTLALQVLMEARQGGAFVQELLDQRLGEIRLPSMERKLATQLVYGVLRRRGTLDALLRPKITRQPHQVEPWLMDLLRLGAYQLALLTHIPAHAAIHESVELAAAFERPSAKGFVNAVLRAVAPLIAEENAQVPSADALPLEHGQYRKLTLPALPDPTSHPLEYLAAGFSLPPWLARRWLERYGWEEAVRLGFWFAGPAPLWLRCNTLQTDRARCLEAFAQAGIVVEPGEHPQAIRLAEPAPIRELPGYEQGWFTVQDATALRVGSALGPAPGSTVLDLCAAPGGKTTHLAELMRNEGQIVACDVDDRRLETLTELCQRLGIRIVRPHRLRPEVNDELPKGPFDAVLVDVPCSNTGVLGRRPEARWRLRPEDSRRLVPLQTKLLIQAAERIKPGGAIVYSTCSIEPDENQQVVRAVLQALPELVLEAEEEQTPGRPADGGYWARVRRG